jgi:hypothetical protein
VAALSTARSARSPISDAPCSQTQASRVGKSRLLRAFVKQHVTFGPRRLSSTGAPRARLRRAGNPPPFPGGTMPTELASDAMPSALSLRTLICAGIQGSSPRSLAAGAACRFLQSLRFSSTTAGRSSTPRTVKGVAPFARSCGQPCTSRCKAGRAVSGQGPPRVETLASAPSCDDSPRGFAPIRSARTPPVAKSRLRRSKNSDARKGTNSRESAAGRRAGRRPDKGSCFCPPAKGDVSRIPEVPSIDRQPGGRHNNPQAVSNLWTTSCGAFDISA